jgi:hypothetical protein
VGDLVSGDVGDALDDVGDALDDIGDAPYGIGDALDDVGVIDTLEGPIIEPGLSSGKSIKKPERDRNEEGKKRQGR